MKKHLTPVHRFFAWPSFESLKNDAHEAACVRLAELYE